MIRPPDLIDEGLWGLFQAAAAGDLSAARNLLAQRPALAQLDYDSTTALHLAVGEGHADVARLLLSHGAPAAYATNRFLDSPLTWARDRGHEELAELFLEIASNRFPFMEGITQILQAAASGDAARVQEILKANATLARGSDETGETPLHRAAAAGHLEVLELLISAGADPDALRADGRRPIHFALRHWDGRTPRGGPVAAALLRAGAQYNIFLAAFTGDIGSVRKALEQDPALANFEDTVHRRPISAAARRNDLEMVRLLLARGANPSLPEDGAPLGQALWTAVYQNQIEMVRLLLRHGANPDTSPDSSGSALFQARKNPEIHRLLLEAGAHEETGVSAELELAVTEHRHEDVERIVSANPGLLSDPMLFWGEGILCRPANDPDLEMIELLLRLGAAVPRVCKWGPQYYFKHTAIGIRLLEAGMSPDLMNWRRFTLLHFYAATGNVEKARILLDHGAALNPIDDEYRSTPLGCAARWGQVEMVRFLLDRGADPLLAGAAWATPLAWARKKGHAAATALLQRSVPGSL